MAVREANDNRTGNISFDEGMIEMPALGRPFRLGMLYDRNRDCFLPGECLFPSKLIEKYILETAAPGINSTLISGESHTETADSFGNDKALQCNALFGLAHVGSSGKHLIKPKTSNDIVKVAFGVNIFSKYRELKVQELFQENEKAIFQRKWNATHVVSAIKFGGHIAFELERTVKEGECRSNVEDDMRTAASFIELVSGEKSDRTTEDTELTFEHKNITCKLYSDVILNEIPITYEESFKCLKQIPSIVKDENAPVTVWLYPLSKLFPGTIPKIVDVVQDVRLLNHLDELGSIHSEIKSLMKSRSFDFIPDVVSTLNSVRVEVQKIEEDLRAFVIKNRLRKDSHNVTFDSGPIQLKKIWLENAIEEVKVLDFYIKELKELIQRDSAALEAQIFKSDELVHLTVSLPLLRTNLTPADKTVIKRSLTSAQGSGQSSSSTEMVQEVVEDIDEGPWVRNSGLKNLFRKYMNRTIKNSSYKDYAVTFVDIKPSKNLVNCFQIDIYKSGVATNDPDFDFFDD